MDTQIRVTRADKLLRESWYFRFDHQQPPRIYCAEYEIEQRVTARHKWHVTVSSDGYKVNHVYRGIVVNVPNNKIPLPIEIIEQGYKKALETIVCIAKPNKIHCETRPTNPDAARGGAK